MNPTPTPSPRSTLFKILRRIRLALACIYLAAAPGIPVPAALAQTLVAPSLAPLGALAVSPQSKAVRFRQTQFEFTAGRMLDSDWGQIEVDPSAVRKLLGPSGGYVNVALFTPGSAGASWVVENLRVVPDGAAARDEVSAASLAAEGLQGTQPVVPMTTTLDLRPGVRGSGRVVAVHAAVVVSEGLLPPIDRVWNLVQQVPPALFEVTPLVVNAEGGNGNAPPTSLTTTLQLGDPPQPIRPRPELPIGFATEVYQLDQPNMHSAKNQCLPMAMANVVGYLRLRYNHPPLSWPLPHHSSPGIGRTMSAGNVIFWQADPSISRTAQIDARTRRTGVYDFETGSGALVCQLMPGLFSYFATQGAPGMVSFTHQDSAAVIGAGNACDTGDPTLPLGGYTSVQQGPNVTWAWLFQQLQQGRGVFMMFGRYDEAGKRAGGHALRVWGARRFAGVDTIYTLDDGDQGLNTEGLRTEQWEVADRSSPGMAGVPNGRLELSGLRWEIEIAVAVEAKPTLLIP